MSHKLSEKLNAYQSLITNYMYLGLLPFVVAAVVPWVLSNYTSLAIAIFSLYSTVILAFLAGAVWAMALMTIDLAHRGRHFHCAIIFSLIPFFVAYLPFFYRLSVMLLTYLALLFWEKCFINGYYPSWYQRLRHKITFIVVACHMIALWNLLGWNVSDI